jgi:hypothetical protein
VASSLHPARKVVKKNENPRQTYFVQLGLGYMDAQNITGRTAEHFIECGAGNNFQSPWPWLPITIASVSKFLAQLRIS